MDKERDDKKEKETEKIEEIFEVKENGKEKIIETEKEVEKKEEKPSKKEIKKENKILRNFVLIIGGFILMFVFIMVFRYYVDHFEVEGVKFEVIKSGQLTFYRTSLPGIINDENKFEMGLYEEGNKADYSIYLRTDPRVLQNIEFHERISQIKKENVINMEGDFGCNGDGTIAVANLLKLYEIIGANVIKDETASCDEKGRYGWINIQSGEKTNLERFGPACFNINIKNCEILEGTEKFILETLIEINGKLELARNSK